MKFNDAFWKWFGDSKVVDSDGNPLVVYHGGSTRDKYFTFAPHKAKRSLGFMGAQYDVDVNTYFFSESIYMARAFAENRAEHRGDAWIHKVYLSVQNPLNLTGDYQKSVKLIKETGSEYWGEGDKGTLWKVFDRPKSVQSLMDFGYDGAVIFDTDAARSFKLLRTDPKSKITWCAFHPNQIKSATINDGSYDVDDPDIRSNPTRRRR